MPVKAIPSSASKTAVGKQNGDALRLEREGVQDQGAGDDRTQGQSE